MICCLFSESIPVYQGKGKQKQGDHPKQGEATPNQSAQTKKTSTKVKFIKKAEETIQEQKTKVPASEEKILTHEEFFQKKPHLAAMKKKKEKKKPSSESKEQVADIAVKVYSEKKKIKPVKKKPQVVPEIELKSKTQVQKIVFPDSYLLESPFAKETSQENLCATMIKFTEAIFEDQDKKYKYVTPYMVDDPTYYVPYDQTATQDYCFGLALASIILNIKPILEYDDPDYEYAADEVIPAVLEIIYQYLQSRALAYGYNFNFISVKSQSVSTQNIKMILDNCAKLDLQIHTAGDFVHIQEGNYNFEHVWDKGAVKSKKDWNQVSLPNRILVFNCEDEMRHISPYIADELGEGYVEFDYWDIKSIRNDTLYFVTHIHQQLYEMLQKPFDQKLVQSSCQIYRNARLTGIPFNELIISEEKQSEVVPEKPVDDAYTGVVFLHGGESIFQDLSNDLVKARNTKKLYYNDPAIYNKMPTGINLQRWIISNSHIVDGQFVQYKAAPINPVLLTKHERRELVEQYYQYQKSKPMQIQWDTSRPHQSVLADEFKMSAILPKPPIMRLNIANALNHIGDSMFESQIENLNAPLLDQEAQIEPVYNYNYPPCPDDESYSSDQLSIVAFQAEINIESDVQPTAVVTKANLNTKPKVATKPKEEPIVLSTINMHIREDEIVQQEYLDHNCISHNFVFIVQPTKETGLILNSICSRCKCPSDEGLPKGDQFGLIRSFFQYHSIITLSGKFSQVVLMSVPSILKLQKLPDNVIIATNSLGFVDCKLLVKGCVSLRFKASDCMHYHTPLIYRHFLCFFEIPPIPASYRFDANNVFTLTHINDGGEKKLLRTTIVGHSASTEEHSFINPQIITPQPCKLQLGTASMHTARTELNYHIRSHIYSLLVELTASQKYERLVIPPAFLDAESMRVVNRQYNSVKYYEEQREGMRHHVEMRKHIRQFLSYQTKKLQPYSAITGEALTALRKICPPYLLARGVSFDYTQSSQDINEILDQEYEAIIGNKRRYNTWSRLARSWWAYFVIWFFGSFGILMTYYYLGAWCALLKLLLVIMSNVIAWYCQDARTYKKQMGAYNRYNRATTNLVPIVPTPKDFRKVEVSKIQFDRERNNYFDESEVSGLMRNPLDELQLPQGYGYSVHTQDPTKITEPFNDRLQGLRIYKYDGSQLPREEAYQYLLQYCRCGATYLQHSGYFGGRNVHPISYDSNCMINYLHGLFGRHVRTQLKPSLPALQRFQLYLDDVLPEYIMQMRQSLATENKTVLDYIENVRISDGKKGEMYAEEYNSYLITNRHDKTLEMFVKTGEISYVDKDDVKNSSQRPRIIFNPPGWMKVIFGYLSWLLIEHSKKFVPGFIHGLNSGQLEQTLSDILKKAGIREEQANFAALDGSNFDGHQGIEVLHMVDTFILSQLMDLLLSLCPELSPQQVEELRQGLLTEEYDFKVLYPHKYTNYMKPPVFLKGKLVGTVISGLCHRTTWGNTIRMLLYINHSLGQNWLRPNIPVVASGDDTLILSTKGQEDFIEQGIYQVFSRVQQGTFGLGQCAKMLDFNQNNIDFLSRTGFYVNGKVELSRQIMRAVNSGSVSSSTTAPKILAGNKGYNLALWARGIPLLNDFAQHFHTIKPALMTFQEKMHVNDVIKDPKLWYEFVSKEINQNLQQLWYFDTNNAPY